MSRSISAGSLMMLILTVILVSVLAYRVTGHVTPLLTVKSGSMEPVLHVGDVIIIEPVNPEDIRVGDVIIFYRPGTDQLIVHRVVRTTSQGLYTRGDANPGIDPWSPVPYENVVGRWIGFKIPNWLGVGYLSLFLSGEIYPPYGPLLILGLIIANIVNIFFIMRESVREGESSEAESSRERDTDSRSE